MNVHREGCEWCNYFVRFPNYGEMPRALLIGDSITNGYNGRVAGLLSNGHDKPEEGDVAVDMVISSFSVSDPLYLPSLALIAGAEAGYRYDVIHLNNGLHGGDNAAVYEEKLRGALDFLHRLQPTARFILAFSTHITPQGSDPAVIDEASNARVYERNEVMRRIAPDYGAEINDLFSAVAGKPEWKKKDIVHFDSAASDHLGDLTADVIRRVLG